MLTYVILHKAVHFLCFFEHDGHVIVFSVQSGLGPKVRRIQSPLLISNTPDCSLLLFCIASEVY